MTIQNRDMDSLFGQRNFNSNSFQRVNSNDIAKHRLNSNTGCSKFINTYIDSLLNEGGLSYRQIRKKDTNISSLLKEVIADNPKFNNSLFLTHFHVDEDLYIDPIQIKFVVDKVLDNALLYNVGNQVAEIHIDRGPRAIILSVKDDGIGIEPFEKNKVYLPFYRGLYSARFSKGIGLGLTLSKEILLNNDAEIRIESQGNGLGTSVYISFPFVDKRLVYRKEEQKSVQVPQSVSC
jgi:signal transduction histidine kinase